MKLLKRKISQLIAFSVFLTSFLTTSFGFFLSQNILKQDTNELINLSCDLIYHDLNSEMESIEQTVKVISSYVMNQLTSVDKSELKNAISYQTNEKLANFFQIFSDETRIKIISCLAMSEMCVNDISNLLKINQTTISHQLKFLKTQGIISCKRNGKIIIYSLKNQQTNDIMLYAVNAI